METSDNQNNSHSASASKKKTCRDESTVRNEINKSKRQLKNEGRQQSSFCEGD